MKFRNFLGVGNTPQQGYYKEGVENIYPAIDSILRLAILPAYDPDKQEPTSWVPAVTGNEEADFYTTVRAAKFVGHGNRRAKTCFLSPRTFDLDADDPYEAFYDYCSRSDNWSYLTKDHRGKKISGELEGAAFPRMRNYFVANVIDVSAGSRGGVFVTELSESVAKSILYSTRKNGARIDGLAFERDSQGNLVFGDITDPEAALVMEIVFTGKAYVARPALKNDGSVMRVPIPETLLQHRRHMEDPSSFLVHPGSGQEIVDKLANMLRGYKSPSGTDEIWALKEAMKSAYGDKYVVDENGEKGGKGENGKKERSQDPFAEAARKTVEAKPEEKSESVSESVDRAVDHEKYIPVNNKPKPLMTDDSKVVPMTAEPYRDPLLRKGAKPSKPVDIPMSIPGEDIDPSDIAAMRAMLSGSK